MKIRMNSLWLAIVCVAAGVMIGRLTQSHDQAKELSTGRAQTSHIHNTARDDYREDRRKGTFQPLCDKRGLLGLQDYATQEQRVLALYQSLDETTPETIVQMVEQYLAMTPGARNRLLKLVGGSDFEEALMQRYGALCGEESIRHLITIDNAYYGESAVRGYVGHDPKAALAYMTKESKRLGDVLMRTFVNETSLAVLQHKISLAEWQTSVPEQYASFAKVIAAMTEGKRLTSDQVVLLDLMDRGYLLGLAPDYVSLLDSESQTQYSLEIDENVLHFEHMQPSERVAKVKQIFSDGNIDASTKVTLLQSYFSPTSYEDLRNEFSPIWKTLDADMKQRLMARYSGDLCALNLDVVDMTALMQQGNPRDTFMKLLGAQEDTETVLNITESLDVVERDRLIFEAIIAGNDRKRVDQVRQWMVKADFLSDHEYQWMQSVLEERQNYLDSRDLLHQMQTQLEEKVRTKK